MTTIRVGKSASHAAPAAPDRARQPTDPAGPTMHLSSHRRPPDSFWNRSTRIAIPYRQSCSKIRRRLERLRTQLQRLRQIAKRRPPRMAQTVVEHLAICAAIQDGDETAPVQATALHINNSLHNIVAAMTDDVIGHTTFATPTTAD